MAKAKELISKVLEFNEKHPVGDKISFREGNKVIESVIRFDAEITENNIPIVWVQGRYNAINLDQVV
jgi:hypothetical protein